MKAARQGMNVIQDARKKRDMIDYDDDDDDDDNITKRYELESQ